MSSSFGSTATQSSSAHGHIRANLRRATYVCMELCDPSKKWAGCKFRLLVDVLVSRTTRFCGPGMSRFKWGALQVPYSN